MPWQRNAESSVGSPSGVLDFADGGFAAGAWTAVACTAMLAVMASRTRAMRVEAAIRARIDAGEWQPEDRLPSVAEFAAEYDFPRSSVASALQ